MEAGAGTELRSDARRNRERILSAGRELFQDSSDVPMYEVAKRAGVGQATLYRHFPDRTALVSAIAEVEFADAVELAASGAESPDTLFALLELMGAKLAELRGLIEVIRSDASDFAHEQRREETSALFAAPLASALRAGVVRADLEMDDIHRILMMLVGTVSDEPDREARRRSVERALALLRDGVGPVAHLRAMR